MKLETLEELFLHQLQDVYDAEKQIIKALPKVIKKSSSPDLRSALEEHLEETENHVNRLEEAFERLGETAKSRKCKAMKGLLEEADDLLSENAGQDVLDAAIIEAAQKVEHYEIAAYGTLATWAKVMGYEDIKELLGETLDEEEKADQKLSDLAQAEINERALEEE